MKAALSLSLALLGLTSCGSSANTDPRVVELHSLHKQLDSIQVNITVPKLTKLGYAIVTDYEIKTVKQMLAESQQNLARLDAFNASQTDQLTFLVEKEKALLSKTRQVQVVSLQDAQERASETSAVRIMSN